MITRRLTPVAIAFSAALTPSCSTNSDTTSSSPQTIAVAGMGGSAGTADNAGAGAGAGGQASADTTPAKTKIDRSALTDVGTDHDLDYSDPRLWLCRPGNDPDECDRNLDATELLPDGSRRKVPHVKASDPAFDCFYVYPTVKLTSAGPMTDFSAIDITLDPLLAQGARFNELCRVYAPLYRQDGVVPGAGGAPTPNDSGFDLGLNDVRNAFKYYVEHLSAGRKFVLLGHSQGTGMLTGMMMQDVDNDPALRARLISALLIGGGISVPSDAAVGGTFQNIPLCTAPRQTGCVIAYNSFSAEQPPTAMSTFAHAMDGNKNGCTEPAALADRAGLPYQGSYVALMRVNASFVQDGFDKLPTDIDTPFIVYRDVLKGACKDQDGASYLEISPVTVPNDQRPPFPYHSAAIEGALGLHLVDYNIELDDLIQAVRLQAEAATN